MKTDGTRMCTRMQGTLLHISFSEISKDVSNLIIKSFDLEIFRKEGDAILLGFDFLPLINRIFITGS